MLPSFALARPRSLAEALELLAEQDCAAYCGGTEILMAMKMGLLSPRALVDLKHVPELQGVRVEDGALVVGAATTHRQLAAGTEASRQIPLLGQVELRVGNARVRSQGSIGGNICFAEPRSDVTTLLAALGARVVLASQAGTRELPLGEFLIAGYETALEPGELLIEVVVPGAGSARGVHLKQQHSERPSVSVVIVRGRPDGSSALAVGAVGEVPHVVEFRSLADVDPAAVAEAVDPTEDLLGSVEYKRHLTEVLVRRALAAAAGGEAA